MNEIYEKLAAAGQLATSAGESELEFDNNARVCDVYEVWSHNDGGNVVQRFPKIESADVPGWLQNGAGPDAHPGHTLLLRLVLVTIQTRGHAKKKTVSIAKDTHDQLIKAFGLKLANEFLKGTITSVTAFPPVSGADGGELCCYAFSHAPKLAAIWSQLAYADPGEHTTNTATQGIIYMTEDAAGSFDPADQKLAEKSAPASLTPGEVLRRAAGVALLRRSVFQQHGPRVAPGHAARL